MGVLSESCEKSRWRISEKFSLQKLFFSDRKYDLNTQIGTQKLLINGSYHFFLSEPTFCH